MRGQPIKLFLLLEFHEYLGIQNTLKSEKNWALATSGTFLRPKKLICQFQVGHFKNQLIYLNLRVI